MRIVGGPGRPQHLKTQPKRSALSHALRDVLGHPFLRCAQTSLCQQNFGAHIFDVTFAIRIFDPREDIARFNLIADRDIHPCDVAGFRGSLGGDWSDKAGMVQLNM